MPLKKSGLDGVAITALSLRGFPNPQQPLRRRQHLGGEQLFHAAVIQRADARLTRAAPPLLQVDRARMVRLGPGDVRRAEQR